MPGLNQTGPMGQGPMTGRKVGRCTNFGARLKNQTDTNNENSDKDPSVNLPGRGLGNRWGRGFGPGHGRGRFGRGMGRQNRF